MKIFCGSNYNFILNENNEIFSFGSNNYGQLGLCDDIDRNIFAKIEYDMGNIKNIVCGAHHIFILNDKNEIYASGSNCYGQLGLCGNGYINIFTKIEHNIENIKNIFCGRYHTFILNDNNEIYASGYNYYGQFGIVCNKNHYIFTKVEQNLENIGNIKTIVCGESHSFILNDKNEIFASGQNTYGQLGLGDNKDRNIFTKVGHNMGNIKNIICGNHHTFILNDKNKIYACGYNDFGQLGLGDRIDRNRFTKIIHDLGNIKNIICGGFHNFILNDNNDFFAIGDNEFGQLGLGDEVYYCDIFTKVKHNIGYIKNIICGENHTFILTNKNEIFSSGQNNYGQLGLGDNKDRNIFTKLDRDYIILNLSNNMQIFCGTNHSFILNNNGKILCSGDNSAWQLGSGNNENNNIFITIEHNIENIKNIICGELHTFILNDKNEIYASGLNAEGQLGLGDYNKRVIFTKVEHNIGTIKNISCRNRHTYILNDKNEIFVSGYNYYGQTGFSNIIDHNTFTKLKHNMGNIKDIVCGSRHTFIFNDKNELFTSGWNKMGQLGLGDNKNRNIFTKVEHNMGNIKYIVCGKFHTFILNDKNEIFSSGYNVFGQLGLGDFENKNIFTKVEHNLGNIKNIFCGGFHTFILNDRSEIFVSGYNWYGQLGFSDKINRNIFTKLEINLGNIKNILCGGYHTFILNDKNKIYCSGSNLYGQLGFYDNDNHNTFIELNNEKIFMFSYNLI